MPHFYSRPTEILAEQYKILNLMDIIPTAMRQNASVPRSQSMTLNVLWRALSPVGSSSSTQRPMTAVCSGQECG